MRAVSITARMTVIRRHMLQPVNGELEITDEMFAEAAAIDERRGTSGSPVRTSRPRSRAGPIAEIGNE